MRGAGDRREAGGWRGARALEPDEVVLRSGRLTVPLAPRLLLLPLFAACAALSGQDPAVIVGEGLVWGVGFPLSWWWQGRWSWRVTSRYLEKGLPNRPAGPAHAWAAFAELDRVELVAPRLRRRIRPVRPGQPVPGPLDRRIRWFHVAAVVARPGAGPPADGWPRRALAIPFRDRREAEEIRTLIGDLIAIGAGTAGRRPSR